MDSWTIPQRIAAIRAAKLAQTREKQAVIGAMDFDDHALILPPLEARELVQTISGSGMPITDVRMTRFMISLEQGVELVWHALDDAVGGEIYVKKIF